MVRISVDLPAPFGPSSPNMPVGIASETSCSALTPLEYVLDRPSMRSSSMASLLTDTVLRVEVVKVVGKAFHHKGTKNTKNTEAFFVSFVSLWFNASTPSRGARCARSRRRGGRD